MQNLTKSGTDMKRILSIPPFASTSSVSSSSSSAVAGTLSPVDEKSSGAGSAPRFVTKSNVVVTTLLAGAILDTATVVLPATLKAQLQVNAAATAHIKRSNRGAGAVVMVAETCLFFLFAQFLSSRRELKQIFYRSPARAIKSANNNDRKYLLSISLHV